MVVSLFVRLYFYNLKEFIMNKLNSAKTKWITFTALFMAINIAFSSFGIPVPGGHLYLCDIVICTASLLLDPVSAFIVGGVGSFLGDMFFYPAPMFVSLVTHGLQAAVISIIVHKKEEGGGRASVALFAGAVIMVVGYSLGRAYVYSTPEYAIIKLPYEILQAVIGAVAAFILCYKFNLKKIYERVRAD